MQRAERSEPALDGHGAQPSFSCEGASPAGRGETSGGTARVVLRVRPPVEAGERAKETLRLSTVLGREPINMPGGWLASVRYASIATKFRSAAK